MMPWVYKRKKDVRPIEDQEKMANCLRRLQEDPNISIRQACNAFDLPLTTVRRHLKASLLQQTLRPPGGIPSLPLDVQADIASIAKTSARHGFGLLFVELKNFIGDYVAANWDSDGDIGAYLRRHCQFVHRTPSNRWVTLFMKQHHLSLVVPSPVERNRQEAVSDPFLIYEFYDILESEMERLQLKDKPSHIYNVDESAFCTDPKGGKVVTEKGVSTHRTTSGNLRKFFTAMGTVNAAGNSFPPLFIFRAKNFYSSWCGSKVVPGTTYAISGNNAT
jgi:hypothetical protein